MHISSRLKPLFASLKRLDISDYIESKEFSYFLLERNADSLWDKCQLEVMDINGGTDIDTAFMYLVSTVYEERFSFFSKFFLPLMLDFAKWSPTRLDFNPAIDNLRRLDLDHDVILSFVTDFRKIQSKKAFKTVESISSNLIDRKNVYSNKVFIVHGHNEEMKQTVARTVEKLDIEVTILHEKPSEGKTVIEKLVTHSSEVSFAIVLLSADDYGYSVKEGNTKKKLRARQNVILELGFFLGKLGRDKVIALFEVSENFDFPTDYKGVIYIPYDKGGQWQLDLIKEFKKFGFIVDANKLVH